MVHQITILFTLLFSDIQELSQGTAGLELFLYYITGLCTTAITFALLIASIPVTYNLGKDPIRDDRIYHLYLGTLIISAITMLAFVTSTAVLMHLTQL